MKTILSVVSILALTITTYFYPPKFGEGSVVIGNHHAPYAFSNVNVIPMDSERILKNFTVLTEESRIVEMGPADEIEIPGDAHIIDGSGKYLIPGLAEMHGHVPPTNPGSNAPDYFNDEYVENTLFLYISAGITTVRGMLGYENQLTLKERVNSGDLMGPNLYLAGPSFNGNTVSSPEQAAERVRRQKEEGWDLLKVHPGLTLEEYDAMAETAHEVGITFGGHVPEEVGVIHAIESRQITIDHVDGYVNYLIQFDEPERSHKLAEVIRLTRENNVWIVPTMALWETIIGAGDYEALKQYDELKYIPQAVRQNYNNYVDNVESGGYFAENPHEHAELRTYILAEMNKAGVKILMGTDAPQLFSVPGFSIHRELPYMKAAGMSNFEILQSGTKSVGDYFAEWDDFGIIAEGQRADLILVNENPLDDLSTIRTHSGVMVQGLWYSRELIDGKLAEIEAYYN